MRAGGVANLCELVRTYCIPLRHSSVLLTPDVGVQCHSLVHISPIRDLRPRRSLPGVKQHDHRAERHRSHVPPTCIPLDDCGLGSADRGAGVGHVQSKLVGR
eukprot:741080-Prymnesium_polylepis.1